MVDKQFAAHKDFERDVVHNSRYSTLSFGEGRGEVSRF